MYVIVKSNNFRRSFKDYKYNAKVIKALSEIIGFLMAGGVLSSKHNDHPLKGDWVGYRELHIFPDVLLVYKRDAEEKTITLVVIGSHSDLFH